MNETKAQKTEHTKPGNTEHTHTTSRAHDIIGKAKALKIPFKGPYIVDLEAEYLHERGIKVWR